MVGANFITVKISGTGNKDFPCEVEVGAPEANHEEISRIAAAGQGDFYTPDENSGPSVSFQFRTKDGARGFVKELSDSPEFVIATPAIDIREAFEAVNLSAAKKV